MLFSQIKLGYPTLWIKSVDSFKAIESIINYPSRIYFTLDPVKGFCEYKNQTWKPVLVDMPNPDEPGTTIKRTTFDFVVANDFLSTYLEDRPKTFVFNIFAQAEEFVGSYAGLFNNAMMNYRDAFWSNDLDQMPLQYIVTSIRLP